MALTLDAPFVSTQWLADRLGDDDLVVVDATVVYVSTPQGSGPVSGLDAYLVDGHVPGAVFADLLETFSDPDGRHGYARPSLEAVSRAAQELGIHDGSTVVVYDTALGQWAARLWWVLRAAGVERVAVLDGGLTAWRAEERPLQTGLEGAATTEPLTLAERPGAWADRDEVAAVVEGTVQATLVCALSPRDFAGAGGAIGHIPGSANLPFGSVVDRETKRFATHDALERRAGEQGRVIVYCHAAVAAAGLALALVASGADDVAVYDGSLNEWAADPEAPLAKLDASPVG
ncbi:sulfurtransferase [Agromyces rhizosphaerae]|uniref:Sulfurtransferase n=1 Tax=Agromyces rhizosphaerae TaxID=88374 RepID=A0A9W6FPP3_9MICO|nr:rhodanese-like domain-containing protein [Agromyces rhizosphaerae]GLI28244.1 sulfurtransferase [Agromyces rhizosphaerae]